MIAKTARVNNKKSCPQKELSGNICNIFFLDLTRCFWIRPVSGLAYEKRTAVSVYGLMAIVTVLLCCPSNVASWRDTAFPVGAFAGICTST